MLRESRKKELKEKILLQAVQLFNEKGYDQVTIQEIASKCGIAKGTFFNYFAKKEEILLYIGESQLVLLDEQAELHQDFDDPKELLLRMLNELLLRFQSHSDIMKRAAVEIIKSAYLSGKEANSIRQLHSHSASVIDRAKQRGMLHSRWETDLIASALVSVYFHTMMSWTLLDAQQVTLSDLLNDHFHLVWEGINSQ